MVHRTAFYGLSIFTSVLQTFFGFYAGFVNGNSPYLYIFGKLAAGFSIFTWLWLSVLMYFNRRPLSTHFLARSLAHFVSFVGLGIVWISIGTMLATQMPPECNKNATPKGVGPWCAAACFSSALAFLSGIFSLSAAYIVYRAARTSGAGLEINVAQANKLRMEGPDLY
ncbi:hypothetical protein CC2G_014614 [Coprinopsis cinerea AmutBmut pab1-1]|nr:hypothetical protein CC2G_014614 [Coprinopsis cinerea AmutBmut pab1-1]